MIILTKPSSFSKGKAEKRKTRPMSARCENSLDVAWRVEVIECGAILRDFSTETEGAPLIVCCNENTISQRAAMRQPGSLRDSETIKKH